jgi:hypothetical protein
MASREAPSLPAAILLYFILVTPPLARWSFDLNDGCLSDSPPRTWIPEACHGKRRI